MNMRSAFGLRTDKSSLALVLSIALLGVVSAEVSSTCVAENLMEKFNLSNSRITFRVKGVCPDAGRREGAFIQKPNVISPPPLIVQEDPPNLVTNFSEAYCVAMTVLTEPSNGDAIPLLFFYNKLSTQIGFLSITRTKVVFELQGGNFTHMLTPADINAKGFVQLQLCVTPANSQIKLYIDCSDMAAASDTFVQPSISNVTSLSIFRPDESPTMMAFMGAVQQLYFLQCPELSNQDQRSLQCRDVPQNCSVTAENSLTDAANNITQTVQWFLANVVSPTQPDGESVTKAMSTCECVMPTPAPTQAFTTWPVSPTSASKSTPHLISSIVIPQNTPILIRKDGLSDTVAIAGWIVAAVSVLVNGILVMVIIIVTNFCKKRKKSEASTGHTTHEKIYPVITSCPAYKITPHSEDTLQDTLQHQAKAPM